MKNLIFFLLVIFFISCEVDEYWECDPGEMRCDNNMAQMCSSEDMWRDNQDCNATGETCIFNQPGLQSGFIGLATCEN